ncbi:hypothetical protein OS493_011122 [Desmophyllum pertusum]|uniref:C2H2-type domain-containing protein n=1 Tax=Desmophyllum pertusum TaxID=174260 RepID=A0A9W9Z1T2_9CNID|nr:hypothetical protein OS493_011122 [Desmophyllum pertusum]
MDVMKKKAMSSDEQNEDQDSDYERQETEVDSPQTDPPVVRSKYKKKTKKKKAKQTCEKCLKNFSTSYNLKHHKHYCKGEETELGRVCKKKVNGQKQRGKVSKRTPACEDGIIVPIVMRVFHGSNSCRVILILILACGPTIAPFVENPFDCELH